ncbi:hypothetical protein ACF08M_05855 [Streptomyces sp. NPDC015032]|uniref:hypothetical protein n=1 Tax=Streptomyces sp. NPDC015032 TaxID=3364937 RepID=UPI0036FE117B
MEPLIDFEVVPDPPEPHVTFKATGLTDTALSVTLEKIVLNTLSLHPRSDAAKLALPAAYMLALAAPKVIKDALEGQSTDIPLSKPLGAGFTVQGQTVSMNLASPELGSHEGMLMISGTLTVP